MTDEQIRETAFIAVMKEQIGNACVQVGLQRAEIASRDAKIKALEAEIAELKLAAIPKAADEPETVGNGA